jgi:hypothetical protein
LETDQPRFALFDLFTYLRDPSALGRDSAVTGIAPYSSLNQPTLRQFFPQGLEAATCHEAPSLVNAQVFPPAAIVTLLGAIVISTVPAGSCIRNPVPANLTAGSPSHLDSMVISATPSSLRNVIGSVKLKPVPANLTLASGTGPPEGRLEHVP